MIDFEKVIGVAMSESERIRVMVDDLFGVPGDQEWYISNGKRRGQIYCMRADFGNEYTEFCPVGSPGRHSKEYWGWRMTKECRKRLFDQFNEREQEFFRVLQEHRLLD